MPLELRCRSVVAHDHVVDHGEIEVGTVQWVELFGTSDLARGSHIIFCLGAILPGQRSHRVERVTHLHHLSRRRRH